MNLYNKLDSFFEYFRGISLICFGFLMIIVYTELVLPSLSGWVKWIVSPTWMFATLGLMWNLGYKDLLKNDNK